MITQFQVFLFIFTLRSIFKPSLTQNKFWENYEWYVLVITFLALIICEWIIAGLLVEPINLIIFQNSL